jgi:hypothetical protein
MNPSLSTMQGLGARTDVGMMLAMPGIGSAGMAIPNLSDVPPPKHIATISQVSENLIENVYSVLDGLVTQAVFARSADEFNGIVDKVFPHYLKVAHGLSQIISIAEPAGINELGDASFSKMESFFQARGLDAYGTDVQNQAIFTVWTLKKISDLCRQINAAPAPDDCRDEDRDLYCDFVVMSMRTTFFLDCLGKSIALHRSFPRDILPILVEGLRSAVNAYADARCALDRRLPVPEEISEPVQWDDEDEQLLRIAMSEIIPEPK